jgi:hypothetical protein
MTMPNERTRAFIQTRDFLLEYAGDAALPAFIRLQVHQLLRHYPSSNEMLRHSQLKRDIAGRATRRTKS